MGWERKKYYTRSRRVCGRVVREYVGAGVIGQFAAETDATNRLQKALDKGKAASECDAPAGLDRDLAAIDRLTDALARAALVAAGYHQHHRGEWRRKRERKAN